MPKWSSTWVNVGVRIRARLEMPGSYELMSVIIYLVLGVYCIA